MTDLEKQLSDDRKRAEERLRVCQEDKICAEAQVRIQRDQLTHMRGTLSDFETKLSEANARIKELTSGGVLQ